MCNKFSWLIFPEEAAVDEKKGKLYKPKSKILEAKTFLPLETPPQFLALDKRNVSFTQFLLFFCFSLHNGGKEVMLFLKSLKALKKVEKEKKKSNLELFKEELKQ